MTASGELRPFPVQVDGDYIGDHAELELGIEPGALTRCLRSAGLRLLRDRRRRDRGARRLRGRGLARVPRPPPALSRSHAAGPARAPRDDLGPARRPGRPAVRERAHARGRGARGDGRRGRRSSRTTTSSASASPTSTSTSSRGTARTACAASSGREGSTRREDDARGGGRGDPRRRRRLRLSAYSVGRHAVGVEDRVDVPQAGDAVAQLLGVADLDDEAVPDHRVLGGAARLEDVDPGLREGPREVLEQAGAVPGVDLELDPVATWRCRPPTRRR